MIKNKSLVSIGTFVLIGLVTAILAPLSMADTGNTVGKYTIIGDSNGYTYDSSYALSFYKGGAYTVSTDGTSTVPITVDLESSEPIDLTLNNVAIETSTGDALELDSGNVTLRLSGNNTLSATHRNTGAIDKTSTKTTLKITSANGDGSTDGKLTAQSGDYCAGIGSCSELENLTIAGGTISATGGLQAAGIGSGPQSHVNNLTITGGNITGAGGYSPNCVAGAGIGGGGLGVASNLTITGGSTYVSATGGNNFSSRAIGSGSDIAMGSNIKLISTSQNTKMSAKDERYNETKTYISPSLDLSHINKYNSWNKEIVEFNSSESATVDQPASKETTKTSTVQKKALKTITVKKVKIKKAGKYKYKVTYVHTSGVKATYTWSFLNKKVKTAHSYIKVNKSYFKKHKKIKVKLTTTISKKGYKTRTFTRTFLTKK